jgi:DNA processing protein
MTGACADCLRRTWLLKELAGHLEPVRSEIAEILALEDEDLVAAVGGRHRHRLGERRRAFEVAEARREVERAGLETICRCDGEYPARLEDLLCPPAVIHVAGGLRRFLAAVSAEPVAVVGSRRGSAYGTGVARSLASGLAIAGVPVISGLAMGIDSAAHQGALAAAGDVGRTVAVLPGSADEPYPRGARNLYRQVVKGGVAVSELPPGVSVRSWMFLARNRIIAALAAMTIVVEAGPGSGALLTADYARALERHVGAVPGRITGLQAAGPHELISTGAHLIDGPQTVLDLLFEAGTRTAMVDDRPQLSDDLRRLLDVIGAGHDTPAALRRQGIGPEHSLSALALLELAGYIQRGAGGRFILVP